MYEIFRGYDISQTVAILLDEFSLTAYEQRRPFVLLRPKMFPDGDQWCALYGENIQDGVAGFGRDAGEGRASIRSSMAK